MRYAIRTITPVADIPLPFDLAAAKAHLRVDPSGDEDFDAAQDALIAALVTASMDYVERFTSQVLTPRVLELAMDRFPCFPELVSIPRDPVTAIVSVTYTSASDGSAVVMDGSAWRWADSAPDQILPAFRTPWPFAARERGSVRIRFDAGYDDGLAPPALIAAVKMMLGHLYLNREAVEADTRAAAVEIPLGVRELCMPFRRLLV